MNNNVHPVFQGIFETFGRAHEVAARASQEAEAVVEIKGFYSLEDWVSGRVNVANGAMLWDGELNAIKVVENNAIWDSGVFYLGEKGLASRHVVEVLESAKAYSDKVVARG